MPLDRRLRDGMQRMAADLDPDVEERLQATLRNARRAGRRQQFRAVLAFAAVILAVVLVGPPMIDALRGVAGPGTSPSPTSSVTPRGTYTTTLDSTDTAVASNRMAGDWTIQFGSGPIMTVTAPPNFTGTRSGYTFHVNGSQFRTDLFGEDVCRSLLPGTYELSVAGDQLTFTVVDDSCTGRVALLTSGVWTAISAR